MKIFPAWLLAGYRRSYAQRRIIRVTKKQINPGLMKITHPDRKNPGKLSSPFCVKVLHTDGHA
jgi:hypothetical protein